MAIFILQMSDSRSLLYTRKLLKSIKRLSTVVIFLLLLIPYYVKMLEMYEKDDTDMQASSSDSVPIAQYETLRKELEELQERFSKAQASDDATSAAEER